MGEPYNTTDPSKLVPVNSNRGVIGTAPFGYTKENVWAGMVGFDRPTWIRFLNPKATWFLSGQAFWSYIDGHSVGRLVGNAPVGDEPYFGPIGQWISGPYAGQTERQQNGTAVGNGDQMRQWEHLITFAAQSFYRAGTLVPFIAAAWDPVNDNCELTWYLDYFHTNNFIISPFQKFFWTYGSKAPSNDPWYAGGRFTRRDETGIKVTYQF